MSSQPNAALCLSVNPTEAELNLILDVRNAANAGVLMVVDPDSMTGYQCGRPHYYNGKRVNTGHGPIDPRLPLPLDMEA